MKATVDLKTLLGLFIRGAIISYGGTFVEQGNIAPEQVDALANWGAGATLIGVGIVWSFFQKKIAAKKLKAARLGAPTDL